MLLKNEIIIKTNPSNYKHYINKGYLIDKCGMEILIKINDLPIKSHVKVDCVCTNCKNITKIEFFNYIRQIKDSYYVCKNCWKFKLRNTMIKKYGVSNAREINDVNDKIFKTNMSRYGVGTPLKVEKYREMIFEYYGVKNISQLDRIKEIIPDCAISADVISGFCTETEEDHQDTLSLMEYVEYDFGYMFAYSERPGTPAHKKMEDDVPADVKQRRLTEIIALQGELSRKRMLQ